MKNTYFFFLMIIIYTAGISSPGAGILYVDKNHPDASDSNDGSRNQPWKTIVHAANTAIAGDTVLIKAGIYEDGKIVVANSGEPDNKIIFSAYPGHERQAVIKGASFFSQGNSHLTISGLKITNSPSHGIRIEGHTDPALPPVTDILITGNHTYDTCSSGIAIWGIKWGQDPGNYDNIKNVIIEKNLVELGTHGCKNEIITVANGASYIHVRDNEIRLGDPNMTGGDEGIDFKEGVRNSSIYRNYIHHLSDKAIYIDGGSDPRDPQITNIHIYDNIMMHLPSAGIVVTTEGLGDVDGVYVYNNIAAHTDSDGFRVYGHPDGVAAGGTVRNVHFINNTATQTGRYYGGGFRVDHESASGIVIENNIAWNNKTYDIRGEAETIIQSNLCADPAAFCTIKMNPEFLDSEKEDYRLAPSSPAIDQAITSAYLNPEFDIAGTPRPQGLSSDLGANEYTTNPTENPLNRISQLAGGEPPCDDTCSDIHRHGRGAAGPALLIMLFLYLLIHTTEITKFIRPGNTYN